MTPRRATDLVPMAFDVTSPGSRTTVSERGAICADTGDEPETDSARYRAPLRATAGSPSEYSNRTIVVLKSLVTVMFFSTMSVSRPISFARLCAIARSAGIRSASSSQSPT